MKTGGKKTSRFSKNQIFRNQKYLMQSIYRPSLPGGSCRFSCSASRFSCVLFWILLRILLDFLWDFSLCFLLLVLLWILLRFLDPPMDLWSCAPSCTCWQNKTVTLRNNELVSEWMSVSVSADLTAGRSVSVPDNNTVYGCIKAL